MPEPVPDWRTPPPAGPPPGVDAQDIASPGGDRRHPREQVEMLAHFRRDIAATTVMLKDLTPFGARVEGIGALELDEFVTLSLPGCRPSLAFVAWANEHCAGLQFIEPLAATLFDDLVRQYGLRTIDPDRLRLIP